MRATEDYRVYVSIVYATSTSADKKAEALRFACVVRTLPAFHGNPQ